MSKNIYTIPNILSIMRIIIVPFYVILYFKGAFSQAVILLIISGLSDVIDGFVARKFNQESEIGKLIDPLADKITQIALVICATITYQEMAILLAVVLFKEIAMIVFNFSMLKKNVKAIGARWYGKVATGCFYIGIGLVLINNIFQFIPSYFIYIITIIIAASLIFAMIRYYLLAKSILQKENVDESENHIRTGDD